MPLHNELVLINVYKIAVCFSAIGINV